jgi:hypothetical protein
VKPRAVRGAVSVALLLCGLPTCRAIAATHSECTANDAILAHQTIERLRTWSELQSAFATFPRCDDGVIAEGYSDFVARTLAKDWTRVLELRVLASGNPGFRAFVLRHIDATAHPRDLAQIRTNTRDACPTGAEDLCSDLGAAAAAAIDADRRTIREPDHAD